MRKIFRFAPIITTTIIITLFSCVDSEKNFYDSSFQMPNPMGEGFSAPDGFDWKMTTDHAVTVEVKDEYEGQYYYRIELYDKDPLNNINAILLGNGVAQKGNDFVTSITLPKEQKGFYVKQIDPRNRVEVYAFNISENSNNTVCKLYYVNSQSNRSAMSRTSIATRGNIFDKPDYTSVPADAKELSQVQGALEANKNYKISTPYNGTFNFSGDNGSGLTRLYVASTWKVPENFTFQTGIEIIVMPNGKIETTNELTFVNTSFLTIMESGNVTASNITFTDAKPAGLRNWGTLSIANTLKLSASANLYNKGIVSCKNIEANSSSQIINDFKINIDGNLTLPSTFTLENNGEITAKAQTANSEGAIITNNGKMKFETVSWTNPQVYNNCSIEVTSSFDMNGSKITFNKGYLKAATINLVNGNFNLSNGSMLEATTKANFAGTIFTGTGDATSMVKSPVVTGGNFTYDGNLAIESDNHVEKDPWWDNFVIKNGAYITKVGASKVIIETCGGTNNEGNPGENPDNNQPTFPIEMADNQDYAYIYEDQWPLYGDYDMNDVVMIIKKRKLFTDNKNKVKKFELSIDLCAVGATKRIGAAIMFDEVKASDIKNTVKYENNEVPKNFNLNSLNLEKGQTQAVVPLFDDAHFALGNNRYEPINTNSKDQVNTNDYKNISFTIEFDTPTLSADAFNINKLNIFLIVGGNSDKRREIHIIGFQPSSLAETDVFGGNNDNSSLSNNKYYISKEGLAWGIMVPTNFKWPLEYTNIKEAYPEFAGWVTSGGKDNDKWWNNFDNNKTFINNKNQ